MSKRLRNLILTAVALLVVVGLLVLLLLLPENADPSSSGDPASTADTSVVLIDKSKDADGNAVQAPIRQIEIASPTAQFTVENDEEAGLRVTAYADFTADTTKLSSLVTYLKTITASRLVKSDVADLAGYGFTAEQATAVTVTYHDGTVYAFELGIESPGEAGRYFRQKDENDVYLVSTYLGTAVDEDPLSYIERSLIVAPSVNSDDTKGSAVLRDMELTGTLRPQAVAFRRVTDSDAAALQHTGYVITKPALRSMNDVVLQEISSIVSLTAASVVCPHPTAEQLAEYGLAEPFSVAQFNMAVSSTRTVAGEDDAETEEEYYYNVQPHTVRLGKKDADGNYYALVDELDMVVTLMPSAVPWAEQTYDTLVDPLLFMQMITDIQTITVTAEGQTHVFELTHRPDEDDRDLSLIVTCDGTTYSTPYMRKLYQVLMVIKRTGPATAPVPDTEPTLTVELTPIAGSEGKHILAKLYKLSGSQYLCVQENGDVYQVTARSVNAAIEQLNNYLACKEVIL